MIAASKADREQRRRDVLARFRADRGTYRVEPKGLGSRQEMLGDYLEPFLRVRREDDEATGKPSETEIGAFLEALKKIPRQPEAEGTTGPEHLAGHGARWEELLEGMGLDQFRESVLGWLGSAPLERELTSTSLSELERLRVETHCRLRILEEMLKATEREIDELDVQIRAAHALAS
jgi:hypothetical protein